MSTPGKSTRKRRKPQKKVHILMCSRCGKYIKISNSITYYSKIKRQRDGEYDILCEDCKREKKHYEMLGKEMPPSQLIYGLSGSSAMASLRCAKCGKIEQLRSSRDISTRVSRYGNSCIGYICKECKEQELLDSLPKFKICTKCGGKTELFTREQQMRYKREMNRVDYVCEDCREKELEKERTLTCRICGEKKILTTSNQMKYYKKIDGVGRTYICPKCRKSAEYKVVANNKPIVNSIDTNEYKTFREEVVALYNNYKFNISNENAIDEFLSSLSSLLERNFIPDFDLNVVDGRIISVILHGVSIYKEVEIELEPLDEIYGKSNI